MKTVWVIKIYADLGGGIIGEDYIGIYENEADAKHDLEHYKKEHGNDVVLEPWGLVQSQLFSDPPEPDWNEELAAGEKP